MDYLAFFSAFSIGLLGGAHCIGMCGGIVGALTMAIDTKEYQRRLLLITAYNIGRISSYIFIAIVFYFLVNSIENYFSLHIMRTVAGLLLVAMGLYLANWWRGLNYLEKLGGYLWRLLQPLSKPLLPVTKSWQALLLGAIWGWLPCGLIYSALAYSATGSSVYNAALIMFGFAMGTLPAVLLGSLLAERFILFIKQKNIRIIMAILLIAFGLWTLLNDHHSHDHNIENAKEQHIHH